MTCNSVCAFAVEDAVDCMLAFRPETGADASLIALRFGRLRQALTRSKGRFLMKDRCPTVTMLLAAGLLLASTCGEDVSEERLRFLRRFLSDRCPRLWAVLELHVGL